MSLSQGFPSVFDTITPTNQVLKNLDNEVKKIYNDVNNVMAADGHAHTGNGRDGALIAIPTALTMANTPAGNIVATTVQEAINELDNEKMQKGSLFINVKDYAVGDGTTDDTIAIQAAITVAAGKTLIFPHGLTYLCQPLSISVDNTRFVMNGSTIKQKPVIFSSPLLTVTANNFYAENGIFDGNQSSMVSGQGANNILIAGSNPRLNNITSRKSNGLGMQLYQNSNGVFIGCNFDDNAGLGMETIATSYHKFTDCTFNRNGYGFQKTRSNYADITHEFVAFGVAVRLRSHHIDFSSCEARDNGRDGLNVNQGSYSIKFNQCLCHGNDDGGFTIAADNTSSGLPGESESPYDISYIDCESYNNYTSGLVAYQPVNGLQVVGGRYYNNYRNAGNLSYSDSYPCSIFVASGSKGISLQKPKCYDDKQSAVVTALSNPTFTFASWVIGTMNYYPKVAIYSSAGVFRGYAKITAETTTSVTISPTTYNGVALSSIAIGDTITQAIQHYGAFISNSCTGDVDVIGYTNNLNPSNVSDIVKIGEYGNDQNIRLLNAITNGRNLLTNPTFDTNLSSWGISVVGGSSAVETTIAHSLQSMRLTAGTTEAQADAYQVTGALNAMKNSVVRWGAWVYATTPNSGGLRLYWTAGSTYSTTVYHPGDGRWRWLEINAYVDSDCTSVVGRCFVSPNNTAYFDDVVLDCSKQRESTFDITRR